MATVFSIVMVRGNKNHHMGKANIYLLKEDVSMELGENTCIVQWWIEAAELALVRVQTRATANFFLPF
jgi:hypothetical protein